MTTLWIQSARMRSRKAGHSRLTSQVLRLLWEVCFGKGMLVTIEPTRQFLEVLTWVMESGPKICSSLSEIEWFFLLVCWLFDLISTHVIYYSFIMESWSIICIIRRKIKFESESKNWNILQKINNHFRFFVCWTPFLFQIKYDFISFAKYFLNSSKLGL